MAQRLIRDCTDSDKVNKISREAECFFYRLMMKADDYGNYHGDFRLLKASLYPLLMDITIENIMGWVDECITVRGRVDDGGLIMIYKSNGKNYLHIINFGQRLRQAKKRFPDAPVKYCQPLDSELTATRAPEVEVEVEVEVEENKKVVFESLKVFYGFTSEINYISRWHEISAFLNNLIKEKKLLFFKTEFEFYKKYKQESGEKIHSFQTFIGGDWEKENWQHKYNEFSKIESKSTKGVPKIAVAYKRPDTASEEEKRKTLESYSHQKGNAEKKPGGLGSEIKKQMDALAPKNPNT